LLIGSDRRPGGSFRTDTMVIAILRPNEGQVSLISIPRDLWVSIPGWENQRINTAYQHGVSVGYPGGGPGLLKETILYNLGIRIDHTAMVEFDGFRQIVNTLGGVDVPVACPYTDWRLIDPTFDPENENNWQLYTTGPGVIHMDGDLALWYARSRQKSSDFDRGRRQQEVLRALFVQALQSGTLARIPELYNNLSSTVETDLSLGDILQLAVYAPKMTNADIRSYYIRPPYVSPWTTEGGAYVLLPNEAALQAMLTEALSPALRAAEKQAIVIDVMNGTSIPGYETLAATRLNYAGYETHIIPSDRQDYAYSVLIDKTTAQDRAQSDPILNVMGLPPISLIPAPSPQPKPAGVGATNAQ
jgi:LCP family protein required for cell wall assembly